MMYRESEELIQPIQKEVIMTKYTFCIDGKYKAIEAGTEEEAIKKAGIRKGNVYALVETESFDDKCLLSAITDDTLFGS